jgi:uncharacterized protein (TIGR02147 family)
MANQENLTYQHFMLSEFEGRKARNPGYSLRAYARDLGLAAPKLSEILRGKGGLSEASAKRLVGRLGLSGSEAETFVYLVISKHGRRPQERQQALEKLEKIKGRLEFTEFSLESFKIVADWCHFAILELTEVAGFRSEIPWIAKRLKIKKTVAEAAVERLFDFGLLAKKSNGTWYQTEATLATPSGIPSLAIRNHHRQIIAQAEEALLNVPVSERDFSATTLAVAEGQLEEVQKMIKDFRRNLAKKLSAAPVKERVYCLSIQFFPFDNNFDKNEESL